MKNVFLIGALWLTALVAQAGTTKITYYVNDALGSPVVAMNEAGAVTWRKTYAPYGKASDKDGDNRVGYTGHVEDPNGLVYAGARYYDPALGIFASDDPVRFNEKNPMSFGRYTYANNNPYKFVDPDGREAYSGYLPHYGPDQETADNMVNLYIGALAATTGGLITEAASAFGLAELLYISTDGVVGGSSVAKGPIAGGGAKLDNLSPSEIQRIQNAANRTNQEITVVGSRAKGTADSTSDWDYVMSGKSSQRHSASSSVPRGAQGGEVNSMGRETGIDISQSYNPNAPGYTTVNTNEPHIIFGSK